RQGFPTSSAPYAIGDVSYHAGWTFHHAGPNHTTTPRRAMTIIYIDADITVAEPTNDNQEKDLAAFLPGVRPGDVPDTPLNPVLYRR
ncbi:MAG: phytanoyl-CoA dioxygenase family protein, partial [Stackebrandtia sp.]